MLLQMQLPLALDAPLYVGADQVRRADALPVDREHASQLRPLAPAPDLIHD